MSKNIWKAIGIGGAIASLGVVAFAVKKAVDYYKKNSEEEDESVLQPSHFTNEVVDRPEAQAYEDSHDVEYMDNPYNPASQPVTSSSPKKEEE